MTEIELFESLLKLAHHELESLFSELGVPMERSVPPDAPPANLARAIIDYAKEGPGLPALEEMVRRRLSGVGPSGPRVGGVAVGAVSGGLGGESVAESVEPTAEDAYWRDHYGDSSLMPTRRVTSSKPFCS